MLDVPQKESYNNATTVARRDKMKSAIEEIYYGSFGTHDPDLGEEYSKALEKAREKEEALRELIKDNPEAVKLFEEYQNADGESLCVEVRGYYKQGFRNGFRIALDGASEE